MINIRTIQQNEKRLIEVISKADFHKGYKAAKEKAEFWNQIVTGVNQDKYVLEFRPTETPDQKKTRMNAYNPLTPYLSEKVKTVYGEADRSNKVEDKFTILNDENGEKLKILKEASANYYGKKNPRQYINNKFLDIVAVDQNAYEVIEYSTNDNHRIEMIYPKTYFSEDVVDELYFNNWLQYIIVKEKVDVKSKSGMKEANKFILYAPDYKLTGIEILEDQEEKPKTYEIKEKNILLATGRMITVEDKNGTSSQIFLEYLNTFSKRVPAIKYGFTKCNEHKELFESILRPAKFTLIDNIQKKANFDTILKAHGIYRTFARVPRCDYKNKDTGLTCWNGKLQDGTTCPSCEGTGKTKLHNTDLDVITFPIQNDVDPRERVILSDMVYTQDVNTELIRLYEGQVEKSEKQVSLACFNTNIFDRKELLAGTATEIKAQFKNINNKLYKYEVKKGEIVKFIYEQIAIYKDIEDIHVDVYVPSDFELETLDDLLVMLQRAKESGAPQHLIQDIQEKIIKAQHQDDPEILQEITSFEKFKPFNDLPEKERYGIITLLPENDPVRVKYIYWSEICKKIKHSNPIVYNDSDGVEKKVSDKFWKLPYNVQSDIFEHFATEYYNDTEVDNGQDEGEEEIDV